MTEPYQLTNAQIRNCGSRRDVADKASEVALEYGRKEERERIVEIYTRHREVLSPAELRKLMLGGYSP